MSLLGVGLSVLRSSVLLMLPADDIAILQFEKKRYAKAGARVRAMADELGLTPTVYAQRLNRLIDSPEAELLDPQLIHRLRRLRDKRIAERTPRRRAG